MFGTPTALLASLVAVFIDRPKRFAIAGLALSGLMGLLIGGMVVISIVVMSQF